MENTIETSTFDVLMEGTMYGAQIDSVLMEADAPKKTALNKDGIDTILEAVEAAADKVNAAASTKIRQKYNTASGKAETKFATVDAGVKGAEKAMKKRVAAFATAITEYASVKPAGNNKKEDAIKALKVAVTEAKKNLTIVQKAVAYVTKALGQVAKVAKVVAGVDNEISNWKAISVTVGLIIGGYSVAYGVLKTISGVATGSFLAIKSNINLMYKVAKDPKTYGAKSFIFSGLLATVLVGVGRLLVTVGKVMKTLFNKAGEKITQIKEEKKAAK